MKLVRATCGVILLATALLVSTLGVSGRLRGIFKDASTLPNPAPRFDVLPNGDLIYALQRPNGADIFQYDRQTRTRRLIASTPFFVDETSISGDGRRLLCSFTTPDASPWGLALVDLATGHFRIIGNDGRFSGCDSPAISPDGANAVYAYRDYTPIKFQGRDAINEVDLETGDCTAINHADEYYSIYSTLYRDDNHVVFTADRNLRGDGTSSGVIGEYARRRGHHNIDLRTDSEACLLAYIPNKHAYWALVRTQPYEQDQCVAFIDENALDKPATWRILPIRTGWARYDSAHDEVLYSADDDHAYIVDSYSLKYAKAHTVLALRKQGTPE